MPKGNDLDVVVIGNVGVDTCVIHPDGAIDFSVEANFTENVDYVGQAGGFSARGWAIARRSSARWARMRSVAG